MISTRYDWEGILKEVMFVKVARMRNSDECTAGTGEKDFL
jgi:hypothetical protein